MFYTGLVVVVYTASMSWKFVMPICGVGHSICPTHPNFVLFLLIGEIYMEQAVKRTARCLTNTESMMAEAKD